MESSDPMMRPDPLPEDADRALRPQALDEFTGQAEARKFARLYSIRPPTRRGDGSHPVLWSTWFG